MPPPLTDYRTRSPRPRNAYPWALLALLFLILPLEILAGDVEVRVVERKSARPVESAAVCLGTPAALDQFGAIGTPPDGIVRFRDIPGTEVILTVSREGFLGYRSVFTPPEGKYVVLVRLSSGGLGPSCASAELKAGSLPTGKLAVLDLLINQGARSTSEPAVTLMPRVSGNPVEYRVSTRADFRGARWKAYRPSIRFQLSPGAGPKVIYFQVRRRYQTKGVWIEGKSTVISRTIYLR